MLVSSGYPVCIYWTVYKNSPALMSFLKTKLLTEILSQCPTKCIAWGPKEIVLAFCAVMRKMKVDKGSNGNFSVVHIFNVELYMVAKAYWVLIFLNVFLCVWVFFLHICLCHLYAWCLQRPEGSIGTLKLELCELPCSLGLKSGSSGRAAISLHHWAITLGPGF